MTDHAVVAALLDAVRRRRHRLERQRTWAVAMAGSSLLLALALVTQYASRLAPLPLALLWGGAVPAVVLVLLVAALRRPPGVPETRLARFIEERCPEFEDALVTAVAARTAHAAAPLTAAVCADAARHARTLDLDRVIPSRRLRRSAWQLWATAALLAALCVASAGPVGHAWRLAAGALFPVRLVIEVSPGDVRLTAGDPLTITARIAGGDGAGVPALVVGDGDAAPRTPMTAGAAGFAVTLPSVAEGFRYRVVSGHAVSREYEVTVRRPPRVARIDLRYEYPPALRLPVRQEADGGDIYGPAGTRVVIDVYPEADTEAGEVRGALTLGTGAPADLQPRDGRLQGSLTIAREGTYRVHLVDADGLENGGGSEYFIRVLEDRPPSVRIVRPGRDRKATRIEEVTIEARADDDHGIAAMDLVFAVRGGAEQVVPFTREGGDRLTVTGGHVLLLEELDVAPGDFITYYARVRDVARGKGASEARSDIFFLDVSPFTEEFVVSQRQGVAGSQEERSVEALVEAQKEIITATWRLDRRTTQAGGRLRDDLRALAMVQGQLRARTASTAAQSQRARDPRRRGAGAGPQPANPSADALRRAADAMGRAQRELDAASSPAALPHEMAALNDLLRAAAEVRRREVQRQQQAGGGAGSGQNRQQQDLSSLFDRELAREQQTNYETPAAGERRAPPAAANPELERVRELARRQEQLTRDQQELARQQAETPASGQDLRRQLERLAREQAELREQVDALARRLANGTSQAPPPNAQASGERAPRQGEGRPTGGRGQAAQGDGEGRSQGAGGGTGDDLRQVAEEMRGAAGDLLREDARRASTRGSRALERLREVERQLGAGEPGDRQRAVGDAQFEARQIAEAQRRLTGRPSDAARDGAASDSPDAARRRAGEQMRLADRMARLEAAVRGLAGGAPDTARGRERARAVDDAAETVERQRLSERMRELAGERPAGQLGAPGRGGQPRPGAEDVARDVERLADELAEAGSEPGRARELSGELARLRDLREELERRERQIDGAARGGSGQGRGGAGGADVDDAAPWDGTRELLAGMRRDLRFRTPESEAFYPGRSAPGTEAWKQDRARWDQLKVQLRAAIERAERTAAARLREERARDRLPSRADGQVPDAYRQAVDDYYRALADGEGRRP